MSSFFGLNCVLEDIRGEDFDRFRKELARTRGLVSLGNQIQRVRSVFKYAHDADMIKAPIRVGPGFKRPSRRALRKDRQGKGVKMFEAHEIRAILEFCDTHLRAMVLLGVNCGFGNNDCGTLTLDAIDLKSGWVEFPRPKTGTNRRCPLWQETVDALSCSIAIRSEPKDESDERLVFVTKYGRAWAKKTADNPISKEMSKLLKSINLYKHGVGFYALRHTFETIGGESRDQVAVDHIMGHVRDDMASIYRERISDERLLSVSDFVRNWLFQKENNGHVETPDF